MKYLGGKFRQSKVFVPVINKIRNDYEYYVEPFCGGCNIVDKIGGKRIASDVHSYLIAMWKALQQGWIPPTSLSEKEYNHIKLNKDQYPPELVAFAGFLCTFGALYFAAYARGNKDGSNNPEFARMAHNVLLKQIKLLQDVEFIHSSYENLVIPPNSLVYCDPPYHTTTVKKYVLNRGKSGKDKVSLDFDYNSFIQWAITKVYEDHCVLISSYIQPHEDFVEIARYTGNSRLGLSPSTGSKVDKVSFVDVLYCHKLQKHLFDNKT